MARRMDSYWLCQSPPSHRGWEKGELLQGGRALGRQSLQMSIIQLLTAHVVGHILVLDVSQSMSMRLLYDCRPLGELLLITTTSRYWWNFRARYYYKQFINIILFILPPAVKTRHFYFYFTNEATKNERFINNILKVPESGTEPRSAQLQTWTMLPCLPNLVMASHFQKPPTPPSVPNQCLSTGLAPRRPEFEWTALTLTHWVT